MNENFRKIGPKLDMFLDPQFAPMHFAAVGALALPFILWAAAYQLSFGLLAVIMGLVVVAYVAFYLFKDFPIHGPRVMVRLNSFSGRLFHNLHI